MKRVNHGTEHLTRPRVLGKTRPVITGRDGFFCQPCLLVSHCISRLQLLQLCMYFGEGMLLYSVLPFLKKILEITGGNKIRILPSSMWRLPFHYCQSWIPKGLTWLYSSILLFSFFNKVHTRCLIVPVVTQLFWAQFFIVGLIFLILSVCIIFIMTQICFWAGINIDLFWFSDLEYFW